MIQAIGVLLLLALVGAGLVFVVRGRGKLTLLAHLDAPSSVPRESWGFGVSSDGARVVVEDASGLLTCCAVEGLVGSSSIAVDSRRRAPVVINDWRVAPVIPLAGGRSVVFMETLEGERANVRFTTWDLAENKLERWGNFSKGSGDLVITRDGSVAVALRGWGIALETYDVAQRARTHAVNFHDLFRDETLEVSLSSDERTIYTLHDSGKLRSWSRTLESLGERNLAVKDAHRFVASGPRGLVFTRGGELVVVDLATGKHGASRKGEWIALEASPDPYDDLALAVTRDGVVHLIDVTTLRDLDTIPAKPGSVVQAHFRPGSREILVSRGPGSLERWSYARVRW